MLPPDTFCVQMSALLHLQYHLLRVPARMTCWCNFSLIYLEDLYCVVPPLMPPLLALHISQA